MDLSLVHLLSACLLLVTPVAAQSATAPQEIFANPAFSQQQTCVQSCFTSKALGCVTDLVGSVLECPINPCTLSTLSFGAPDNCYCRGDLQGAAQSFISSCVQASCGVGDTSANVATAVSMYASYCTALGFTAYAPASKTGDDATSLNTNLGTSGTTNRASGATNTGSDLSDSTSPSRTTLYITLAVVGGVAALLFISSATWAHKYRKLKQKRMNGYQSSTMYNSYAPPMQPTSSHNSSHPLRFDHELTPTDSASNLGVPVYPHPHEPSLVSTRMY